MLLIVRRFKIVLLSMLCLIWFGSVTSITYSREEKPIIDFTSRTDHFNWTGGNNVLGYEFEVVESITVEALGVFDFQADGLNFFHQVGLWNTDAELLASAFVGPNAPLTDPSSSDLVQFVYHSITPLVLEPGTYRTGALYFNGQDVVIFQAQGMFSNTDNIRYTHNHWFGQPLVGLQYPDHQNDDPTIRMYFGPIARFNTTTKVLGDVNCDGAIDLLDVAPFVELLVNGQFSDKADINGDGSVDLLDIDPFVVLLSAG